ncbi:glycoside hydrolase superfamily [Coniochaeta sp. 2T2.1]|nr:glycoside hydrolase superfamily [Coniochaeta sp. 2T2.1]
MSLLFVLSFYLLSVVRAKVQFLGVAIAGGDFGCEIDGSCPTSSTQLPLKGLGGGDGAAQMNHFVKDDQMNMFRIPISWQFLANNKLGATLDSNNLGKYDQVMQACFSTGAHCMIDIHNFARWNGGIIGQGGPTDEQFVGLWTQLATKYAANPKVVFGLMNEPHDLDINIWAETCQKVVTAIRNAGAKSQMILLPGTNFDNAATLVSSGSAEALMAITNPDGTTDGLLLDIHKYLDADNSGTHSECVTDNTAAFATVADFLRQKGRQGLVSETGASSAASCMTAFCAQNAFINANSDVFVGLVAWAAGSFSSSYLLSLTPTKQGNGLVNNALAAQCVVRTWLEAKEVVVAPLPSTAGSATSSGSSAAGTGSATAGTTFSAPFRPTTGTGSTGQSTTSTTGTGSMTTALPTGGVTGNSTSPASSRTTSGSSGPSPTQPIGGSWAATVSAPKSTGAVFSVILVLLCTW